MDFHLATEPPSSRGARGWAHAVSELTDVELTVCGLPVGALVDWPDIPFPDEAGQLAYCPGCAAGVSRNHGD